MKTKLSLLSIVALTFIATGCGGGTGTGGGGSGVGSSNSDVSPGYLQVDACSYLGTGMYAFKRWATPNIIYTSCISN